MNDVPVIGITLGDANGIGPEVAWKAAHDPQLLDKFHCILIGSEKALHPLLNGETLPRWTPDEARPPSAPVSLWDPAPDHPFTPQPGTVQADAAACAGIWIKAAVQACQSGAIDAMVTAPIHKAGFMKAGINFPGHTEMLADETKTTDVAMLLVGGPLRVLTATRHLSIREVPDAITEALILDAIRIMDEARPWLQMPDGPIAVCALNPHAGDGGAIGMEEIDIIQPAIQKALDAGFKVEGPVPADTVFHAAVQGRYPAVICMYHDQGLGPLKMLAFDQGVNITLGLPIVRTSPDHGTAYDIAGQNKARPDSMICAIQTAIQLSKVHNPWAR